MTEVNYTNRYGDQFTFTKNDDGDILWEGNFEYCRFGYPNDYKRAYQAYCKDASDAGFEKVHSSDFVELVHESIYDADGNYLHPGPIAMRYGKLVKSITSRFNMIDPSGGPFIKEHMDLGAIAPEFKGLCVLSFHNAPTGYLIQTYGKYDHLADHNLIGGLTS